MYRTISKPILVSGQKHFICNGIAQVAHKRPLEINTVKLMGTIQHKVKRLSNDTIKLFLQTVNEDTTYCIHKVAIANPHLLNIIGNQLTEDKRIYIGGKIKTENLYIENQRHQSVEILANELFLLESNPKITDETMKADQPYQLDQNSIEMMAFIGTEVFKDRNLCAFSLTTHYETRKGLKNESTLHDHHKVVIYNNPDMLRIARNLNKHDRVYVNGFINYITKKYPDGKDYTNGYIQPTNLVKLKKFNQLNQTQLKS